MNATGPPEINELLIASVSPQNLERGVLWFKENLPYIKKARNVNPWWRDNSLIVERGWTIKPSELLRRIADLRYERANTVLGKGSFAVRGGIIEIWPINTEKPHLVEFYSNSVTTIKERTERREEFSPRPSHEKEIEKTPPGSFVVHIDHGIGIYQGKSQDQKSYVVKYAAPSKGREPDRLYVPTDQKGRLTVYVGFEEPRIHRLGGDIWAKTKKRAKEGAEKLAQELLAVYAKRHFATKIGNNGDSTLENNLKETFPYVETVDQLKAEKEILDDLEKERPMDRMLCGEVGFGKTEIAIRASLRVIASGKQVAVLAPTTILAAQHAETFKQRLCGLPVNVKMLSRLNASPEEKKTLQELEKGEVDCVIGTHRLLSQDVKFKNLGLVIIDEEQRFGVKQKEHFKELRSEVDILSLSATPIPRTTQLTLAKLRDLSVIETPPPERIPIKTVVLPYSKNIIKSALEFEVQRDGQVYFLHNRIETIGAVKNSLESLSPSRKVRVEALHGRMPEKEMMHTMDRFRNRRCDVLVATTIIENGLDISSANTLIVEDATRLGLAEAHQLRGRIGRGNQQAFAYFLYKPRGLTTRALERLEALVEYSDLGSGYKIALRDLEIRGAGNILGKEQSGSMNRVGLNLYFQILAEAVEKQKTPH